MPTADDMIAIQNMQSLAQSMRGAGQNIAEGQIAASGIAESRRTADVERQAKMSQLREQMKFSAAEGEKNRDARTETSDLDRISREKIAEGRKPPTFNIKNTMSNIDNKAIDNVTNNGMINENGALIDTSTSQAKTLKDSVLDISGMSDEEFSHATVKDKMTRNSRDMVTAMLKQGHKQDSGIVAFARELAPIADDKTRKQYAARLMKRRELLIGREVGFRMKKEDFTKQLTGGGTLAGANFRTASPAEQNEQRARVRPRILREVTEEFGGLIDLDDLFDK